MAVSSIRCESLVIVSDKNHPVRCRRQAKWRVTRTYTFSPNRPLTKCICDRHLEKMESNKMIDSLVMEKIHDIATSYT